MTTTIIVTPSGLACPVSPCPATPGAVSRLSDIYSAQKAITLAKSPAVMAALKSNPVPKGKSYE
jgi:hypothetical protein